MLIKITFTFLFSLVFVSVFAQSGPPATPIDGGLTALLIAGGIYGVKKLRENHRH